MANKDETVKRIRAAALVEFGEKGYSLASTNAIHRAADVSKGTIFLHFKNKAGLFYDLFSTLIDAMIEEMDRCCFEGDGDVFDRMVAVSLWKTAYFANKPFEARVLLEAVSNPPPEIKEQMRTHLEQLTLLSIDRFFHEIDMERFKPEYTKDEVFRYIALALAGIQNNYVKPGTTMKDMMAIRDDSIRFLKTVIKGMEK